VTATTLATRLNALLADGTRRTLTDLCLTLGASRPEVRGAIYLHRTAKAPDGTVLYKRPLIAEADTVGTWRYTTHGTPTAVADYQDHRGHDTHTRVRTQLDVATKALALTPPGTPDWARALAHRDRWVAWEAAIRAAL
jgi:hypothetical protein